MKSVDILFHTILKYDSDSDEKPTVKSLIFESHFDFNKIEAISIDSIQDGQIGYVNQIYLQNEIKRSVNLEEQLQMSKLDCSILKMKIKELEGRLEKFHNLNLLYD